MAIKPTWRGWRPHDGRDPRLLLDGANSVLAVGLNYYVDAQPSPGSLKVARYGWGRDYHRVVDQRLRRIGRWLSEQRPDCGWRACVDATPLLDKAWAEEAGLGWIGKHSNLIHSRTGLVDGDRPSADHRALGRRPTSPQPLWTLQRLHRCLPHGGDSRTFCGGCKAMPGLSHDRKP